MRSYSGKFVVRLPAALHETLTREAQSCGCSLNNLIVTKLSKRDYMDDPAISDIIKLYSPLAIIRFGSTARGEATEFSDIDLLIVLDSATPIERNLYLRWEKEMPRHTKYSPQFVHLPSSQYGLGGLWLEAALEGETVFSRGTTIREFMSSVKNKIAQGEFVRKWTHGQPYWISKSSAASDCAVTSKGGADEK